MLMKESAPPKKAVVIHSGGMDSSLCLALAIQEWGKEEVVSLSFAYGQRHANEVEQASRICRDWDVEQRIVSIDCLRDITVNALVDPSAPIFSSQGKAPTTWVVGRNGLLARLGAIYAASRAANILYLGVIEAADSNSGYPDCSRAYMDLKQQILRIDLQNPLFEIRTPLVSLSKEQTLDLAHHLGLLRYLLRQTISCYEGIPLAGCRFCPSCRLRNESLLAWQAKNPSFALPYRI